MTVALRSLRERETVQNDPDATNPRTLRIERAPLRHRGR
jgi:hypothetical protein